MPFYAGLDVSQKTTAICVVDQHGARRWRGTCATDPSAIAAAVGRRRRCEDWCRDRIYDAVAHPRTSRRWLGGRVS